MGMDVGNIPGASENGEVVEEPGVLETRTQIFIDGVPGEPLVDKVERTSVGMGGMSELTEIRLRRANGCGHVLHTGQEAGSVCGCGRVLCAACAARAENLCTSCRRPVCGACQAQFWPSGDEAMLCRACSRRRWWRELLVAGAITLAVFLILVVFFAL